MNAITGTMANVRRVDLAAALATVASVVERRNTVPILAHVWLRGDGERLTLRATNMDMEALAEVMAPGSAGIDTTVSAAVLRDLVKRLPADELAMRQGEAGALHVQAGDFAARLMGMDPADYPVPYPIEWPVSFEVAADALRGMLGRVQHAISTEETRYYLNGVYLHVQDGRLVAVATDGYRLALNSIGRPPGAEAMPGVIVPLGAVAALLKMIDKGADPVRVEIGWIEQKRKREIYENRKRVGEEEHTVKVCRARFRVGRLALDAKLIDGTFPDYSRVIPRDMSVVAKIAPAALLASLQRLSPVRQERSAPVKLEFLGERLRLSMVASEVAEAEDAIRIVPLGAFGHPIGFQSRYLVAALKQAGGDVTVRAIDRASPITLTDEADPHALYVLMPMRI